MKSSFLLQILAYLTSYNHQISRVYQTYWKARFCVRGIACCHLLFLIFLKSVTRYFWNIRSFARDSWCDGSCAIPFRRPCFLHWVKLSKHFLVSFYVKALQTKQKTRTAEQNEFRTRVRITITILLQAFYKDVVDEGLRILPVTVFLSKTLH